MDIINVDKFIAILNGYKKEGSTAINLEKITELFEEYKDYAMYGDSANGFITKPGKSYEGDNICE